MASSRPMPAFLMRKRKLTCGISWTQPLPQWRPPCHHPAEAVPAEVGAVVCAPETAGVEVSAAVAADVPVAVSMNEDLDLSSLVADSKSTARSAPRWTVFILRRGFGV